MLGSGTKDDSVTRAFNKCLLSIYLVLGAEGMVVRPAFVNLKSLVGEEFSGEHLTECLII